MTLIAAATMPDGAAGLSFDCSGTLYTAASTSLYTVDVSTGAATEVGTLTGVQSAGDFVENLAVICGATPPPTTPTTAAPTTTSTTAAAAQPAVVTPRFTG